MRVIHRIEGHEIRIEQTMWLVQLFIDDVLQEQLSTFGAICFGDYVLTGIYQKKNKPVVVKVISHAGWFTCHVILQVEEEVICEMESACLY